MINLRIKLFKCFRDADIQINKLTVLAGGNGFGKSTVVQAILFLRYTLENLATKDSNSDFLKLSENYPKGMKIPLNGYFMLSLGDSSSLLNKSNSNNNVSLRLKKGKASIDVLFEADNLEPQLSIDLKEIIISNGDSLPILKKEIYYLNAERVGPRIVQRIRFTDFLHSGWQGEYVAQLISERSGFFQIDKKRLFPGTSNPNLEYQVNEWLNYIIPGVRITAQRSLNTHSAQIQMENQYTGGDSILATNIGFGISYLLPILANGLVAKEGSIFIVENPEAHLHPSAQSKIGRFLSMVASTGVFVIVETHSDHVVNGVQIAIVKKEIKHDSATINFFSQESESQPIVQPISISENGELSNWPKGFFDQSQIDFVELIKSRNV